MEIETIGVHESVDAVFPAARLVDELAPTGPEVTLVSGTRDIARIDLLVTLTYEPEFTAVDWIHSIQAGVDRFPFDTLRDEAVVLTNSTGVHGDFVGNTVVGYFLAFARGLHEAARNQVARHWERPPWDELFTLSGETVCVVGLGTLGRGIAETAASLGLTVVGVKREVEPVDHVDRVFTSGELHEAIADARFVVLALPLSDETTGLVSEAELAAMRDDAYLVNVSRGPIVDTEALLTALRAGTVAGAALDVFDTEPLPAASPVWGRDDVIVTPHIAGLSEAYPDRVAALVTQNLQQLTDGAELINRVV